MEGRVRSKLLHDDDGQRTFAVVLETGDETMTCLGTFAIEAHLAASQVTGIGAFSKASLQFFDWEAKEYKDIPVNDQVEVASLVGDVALSPEGNPALHLHVVLGRRDGAAMAGHLGKGYVRPTLEVIITESPAHLRKTFDSESGLALIKPL
jgi:predicted DNA-binding protein with PD1-like motif